MTDKNKRERRHFIGQQKTAIVKAHLVDGKSVADLCDQHKIQPTQFYQWQNSSFSKTNKHNALVPRDHWLEVWEKLAIVAFHTEHSGEGYRRLTYLMMDQDVVAVSPATVYRVLKVEGCFEQWNVQKTGKGQGFQQPLLPYEHWHVDISYVNVCGTFYYLIRMLDGCSRYLVHWPRYRKKGRESMTEADVEITLQRAKEAFPDARPRIITDNEPQFIAKDFKEFIRFSGMTHMRTSPYYPQSNGKIERWHQTIKQDCIRPNMPLSLEEARQLVERFVEITIIGGCTAHLATSRPLINWLARASDLRRARPQVS